MAEEVGKYIPSVLNEVLSLNAQESTVANGRTNIIIILNEVLSLNAQESRVVYSTA